MAYLIWNLESMSGLDLIPWVVEGGPRRSETLFIPPLLSPKEFLLRVALRQDNNKDKSATLLASFLDLCLYRGWHGMAYINGRVGETFPYFAEI